MSKKAKKTVPDLRFPDFEGDWEEKRLEKLFSEFKSGNNITANDICEYGSYPVFGGNGLRGFTETYTHDGFYFLIGRQGALCGNINRVHKKSYISEHAIACKANETSDTEWLAQRLDYYNLNRLSESSAQPGLSVKKLLRFKLYVPTLPEQQKIAEFLSTCDEKLNALRRKKECLQTYKRGVMQGIFSQKIRFKNDDGSDFPDWEEQRFENVFKRIVRKNEEYFNKSVSASDVTGYYLIHRGEFAYNKSYSKGYPMGAIKRLKRYEKGVVSTLYICFKIQSNHFSEFYEHFFDHGALNHEISKIAQEGARNHGLLNISVVEFFRDIKITVPDLEEQKKIADFLTAIDQKIEAVGEQIDRMERFKKGLLQKMFV